MKSQFATSKGGSRKGHFVFTEQGVAMLATILKSKVATQVSIAIMDDAYFKIFDIFKSAKKELVVIYSYDDNTLIIY